MPTHQACVRSIADPFAHLHNVRIMWHEVREPAVAESLSEIAKGMATKAALKHTLEASPDAFANMLGAAERSGKLKSAKRGICPFLACAIAHEAHHRGQIVAHPKHAKLPLDRAPGLALREWERI